VHKIDPQAALAWLKPAHELDRADFWENQDLGLVIFVSLDAFPTTVFALKCQS